MSQVRILPGAPPLYCIVDVETDGPDPARHSLLSLAVVACDEDGREVAAFAATLRPRPGATRDPETMAWWATEPDAWRAATLDPRPAADVMPDLLAFLRGLPGPRVFVAHPLAFDGAWIDAYLQRYAGLRLFMPNAGDPPFHGAGIDLATHVRALFDLPWTVAPPPYPNVLRDGLPHDHDALHDARGHAALFFRSRALARDPDQRTRLRAAMLEGNDPVDEAPPGTP